MKARADHAHWSAIWPLLRYALGFTARHPTYWMAATLLATAILVPTGLGVAKLDVLGWIAIQVVLGLTLNHAALLVWLNSHPARTANLMARAGCSSFRGAALLAAYGALVVAMSPGHLLNAGLAILYAGVPPHIVLASAAAAVALCGAGLAPTGLFFLGLRQAGFGRESPRVMVRLSLRLPVAAVPPVLTILALILALDRMGPIAGPLLASSCAVPLLLAAAPAMERLGRRA